MFDDRVGLLSGIDVQAPARTPGGEVILQREARQPFELRGVGRKIGLEAGVMITTGPHLPGVVTGCSLTLTQAQGDRPHLFVDGRFVVPTDTRVARDRSPVERIAVAHHATRPELADETQQGAVRGARFSGVVMGVAEYHHHAAVDVHVESSGIFWIANGWAT